MMRLTGGWKHCPSALSMPSMPTPSKLDFPPSVYERSKSARFVMAQNLHTFDDSTEVDQSLVDIIVTRREP